MATTINAVRVSRAKASEEVAVRFRAKERGMATRVPVVPGNHGKYPVPAPVAKNRMSFCSLGVGGRSQLCEEEPLGVFEEPLQGWLDSIFRWDFKLQRVHVLLILIELEVEVRSGAHAR